jgi:hypothetical protein
MPKDNTAMSSSKWGRKNEKTETTTIQSKVSHAQNFLPDSMNELQHYERLETERLIKGSGWAKQKRVSINFLFCF